MKSQLILAFGCVASFAGIGSGRASVTIAQWTFETSVPATSGPFAPEFGSGSASGWHVSSSASYSNPIGNGSSESFSASNWAVNDYWQFTVSTLDYSGITLSWDQTSSDTGPKDFQLAYSLDGLTFMDFGSPYSLSAISWVAGSAKAGSSFSVDLSAATTLNDQANVYFRLINISTNSVNGKGVSTGGTDRIDNFTIAGTPADVAVPEPSTCLAGALLLLPVGVSAIRKLRHCKIV